MTEMEMLRELRRVVAHVAGQAGGNREQIKAEIRQDLVSSVKERFGLGTWTSTVGSWVHRLVYAEEGAAQGGLFGAEAGRQLGGAHPPRDENARVFVGCTTCD